MYRPPSPHVLVYKPQFSSVFPIFHRVTGVILTAGLVIMWLGLCFTLIPPLRAHYVIYSISCRFNTHLAWVCIAYLTIVILSSAYHAASGIRHLIWDFYGSRYLNKAAVIKSVYIILTIPVTLFVMAIMAIQSN